MENYQVCKRCVMDTTDPEIVFNNHGFCNHCETFLEEVKIIKPQGHERESQLNHLVQSLSLIHI